MIANETTDEGINFQNIQAVHTTQYQKNKQPNQKVTDKTDKSDSQNRHFSKEDIQMANKHIHPSK